MHCPYEASESGQGLPDKAIQKIDLARTAIGKMIKSCLSVLPNLKGFKGNQIMEQGYTQLGDFLQKLRQDDSILENMAVLGVDEHQKPVTCDTAPCAIS